MAASRFWTARELARNTYFRGLVEAAAWSQAKPFSEELVYAMAVRPEITTALTVKEGEALGVAIQRLVLESGELIDPVVAAGVESFTPKLK